MACLKKVLTPANLAILVGAVILSLALFAPTQFRTVCPQGLTTDPVRGGSCSLFVDADQDSFCDRLYQTPIPLRPSFEFKFLTEAVVFSLLLLTSIIAVLTKREKAQLWRYLLLLFSFFYFGIRLAEKICPLATLQALSILKEAVVLRFPIFLIFILPIVTALILGRVFCGWLCPLGAFQELIYRGAKKGKIKTIKINEKWQGFLKTLPFLTLTVTLAAGLTSQQMFFCRVDPFGYLFGRTKDFFPLFLLIGLVLILPFLFRPFCRYLCPYGAVLGLLSRYSIFHLRMNPKKCSRCKLCEKICPVKAIKNQKINFSDCLLCGECQRSCPKRNVSLSKT